MEDRRLLFCVKLLDISMALRFRARLRYGEISTLWCETKISRTK